MCTGWTLEVDWVLRSSVPPFIRLFRGKLLTADHCGMHGNRVALLRQISSYQRAIVEVSRSAPAGCACLIACDSRSSRVLYRVWLLGARACFIACDCPALYVLNRVWQLLVLKSKCVINLMGTLESKIYVRSNFTSWEGFSIECMCTCISSGYQCTICEGFSFYDWLRGSHCWEPQGFPFFDRT